MRIATWNVNGLRARLEFLRIWLRERRPDVVDVAAADRASGPRFALNLCLSFSIHEAGSRLSQGLAKSFI